MTPIEILAELMRRRMLVWVNPADHTKLQRHTETALPDELRAEIAANRAGIIGALDSRSVDGQPAAEVVAIEWHLLSRAVDALMAEEAAGHADTPAYAAARYRFVQHLWRYEDACDAVVQPRLTEGAA